MDYNKIPNFFKDELDSRKKAKETLTKIFENKMLNIDTIKNIISEFHKHENQNSIEVFNRIERNINESEISTNKILDVIQNTDDVIQSSEKFYNAWDKIAAPINYYGKDLENLLVSKKNVSMMRHNLKIYVQIKDQIKDLRDLLNANDSNIVMVYKQIRYLAYLRCSLLEKINKSAAFSASRTEQLNNLADHLLCVKQFEEEFFNKFWRYFASTITWAVEKPEFLVKLLRLIEEDAEYMRNIQMTFQMFIKPDEKFQGISGIKSNDDFMRSSMMTKSVTNQEETFKELELNEILLYKISDFIDEKFHVNFIDKVELSEILAETQKLASDLYLVHTKVVPCFPPKYNIFTIYKDKYLKNIYDKIQPFMKEQDLIDNPGNLILFAKWLDGFNDCLKKVGVDIKTTEIGSEIEFYMHLFYDHVNNILQDNVNNILEKNLEDKNKLKLLKNPDPDKLQSFYASDIFRSLYNVLDLLSGDIKGQILYEIIKIVVDKLKDIQKDNDQYLNELSISNELICSCVYTLDAQNCIDLFPDLKKKIKKILQKEFYDRIKIFFTNTITVFNNTIRLGCQKSIELIFVQLEENFLCKIFTKDWNSDVLLGIFETFRTYYNRGFAKILKSQNILLIIVRSFVDSFTKYYIEELIHSVRSLNRKKLLDGNLIRYQLTLLKLPSESLKYNAKNDESYTKPIIKISTNNLSGYEKSTNIKQMDKYIVNPSKKEDDETKIKKYNFPVKKFDKESKQVNPPIIFKKIAEDFKAFSQFLDSFKEDAKEPFSKNFTQYLGVNYINTYLNKFSSILDVLKCTQETLKDTIPLLFKEAFSGEEGKVLLEALLYIREDYKSVTKPDLKKFYLNRYEN